MTEDSGEMHVDGEKISAENNKKRRLKTPSQVMALENFYNEHKYPTEEMKSHLAGEIGLTEKQVSGWFCHRRLKDKRSSKDEVNTVGRQDRSSVVIQDRGSGHRQDSCGSTKQTDYKNFEPREVESQRLYGGQYTGNADVGDSTSSESSSSLHERRLVSGKDDIYDVEPSRYTARNGSVTPIVDTQVARNYGYKPSGYLKLKGEIENAAIIAVKRQLGRHYREDGPPPGVEFDPLPPGAFESSANEILHEPIYVGNQRRSHHPHVAGNRKNPSPCLRYEAPDSKMDSPDPFLEDENDDDVMVGVGPSFRGKKTRQQPRLKSPSLNYSGPIGKDLPLEAPLYNSKKSWISSKPGPEGARSSPVHFSSNLETVRASPCDYDNHMSETGHKSGHFGKSSNLAPASGKSPDSMERGLSSGRAKVGKYQAERNPVKTYREKLHMTEAPPVPKKTKLSYLQHCYTSKASSQNEAVGCKSQIKGSCLEVPSSFSEDETAETSSSMD